MYLHYASNLPFKTCDYSAGYSRQSAATTPQIAQRREAPTSPLQLCYFSGFSRASRHAKVTIQRIAPVFPPAISAEVLRISQHLHHL